MHEGSKNRFNAECKMIAIHNSVLGKEERECKISQWNKILEKYQATGSFSTPSPTAGYIGKDSLTSILLTTMPPVENYYYSHGPRGS